MQEWVGQVRRQGTSWKVIDCPSAKEDVQSVPGAGVVLMEERDEPEKLIRLGWEVSGGSRDKGDFEALLPLSDLQESG